MKIKSSCNGEITLLFTDIGKSCFTRKFLASQICLLKLFGKIKFSRKFPNLQYSSYKSNSRLNIMEIFAQFSDRNKNIADLNFGSHKWHNSKVPNLSHQSRFLNHYIST